MRALPGLRTDDAMAGLLACRSLLLTVFPEKFIMNVSSDMVVSRSWRTVAGTASVLNRVPSMPRFSGPSSWSMNDGGMDVNIGALNICF